MARNPLSTILQWLVMGILFTCLASTLLAQDYNVSRTLFLPPVYHVGDRVELGLSLRSSFLNEIQLPQQLPQPPWGIIHDIKITERDDERDLRIIFTSYYPGTQTLPPIQLGPIVLTDISIFVTPLLDRTTLVDSSEQIMLPGTQIVIIVTSLFMIAFLLLWLPLWKRSRRYVLKFIQRHQEGLIYRKLEKNLTDLTANAGVIDGRNFYIQLLACVREYLSGKIQMDVRVATTGELEMMLRKGLENPEDRTFIINLFHHGDLVKFAAQPSTLKSRMMHLDQLREVLAHIESGRNRPEGLSKERESEVVQYESSDL